MSGLRNTFVSPLVIWWVKNLSASGLLSQGSHFNFILLAGPSYLRGATCLLCAPARIELGVEHLEGFPLASTETLDKRPANGCPKGCAYMECALGS